IEIPVISDRFDAKQQIKEFNQ
ncbi:MAG: Lumenal portion of Cytochrome b559, alpha (psbE) subunit, partial [Cyanobacteriota bacterium]